MANCFDGIVERFLQSSKGFERTLRAVQPERWESPTPCTEWNVRQLVNHMARGNLNYVLLVEGGTQEEFLSLRDADALGEDPVGSYIRSVRECAEAFTRPGALQRLLDYPMGKVMGLQALAVRAADSVIHTWDLARAIGDDDTLDAGLVTWMGDHLHEIYAGLAETPIAADTTNRFFAAPRNEPADDVSPQDRVLYRMGRDPKREVVIPAMRQGA